MSATVEEEEPLDPDILEESPRYLSDDNSSISDVNKRVSFNNDVRVKRIPKSKEPITNDSLSRKKTFNSIKQHFQNLQKKHAAQAVAQAGHKEAEFSPCRKESPPEKAEDIAHETNLILSQLKGVECSASTGKPKQTPGRLFASNSVSNLSKPDLKRPIKDSSVSDSELKNCGENCDPSGEVKPMQVDDNKLYGLHALNNLDIAVNGKEVNSMPSYHEVKRRSSQQMQSFQLDSSGGSAEYSPPLKRNNLAPTPPPPKPPRKAPSMSPPSLKREPVHYAQPAISGSDYESRTHSSQMVMQMQRRATQLPSSNSNYTPTEDSAIASGDGATDHEHHTSYTSRYIRKSPPRHVVSPSRLSPSRSCLTDTELLRSPTEVLYAVSDKQRGFNGQAPTELAKSTNYTKNGSQHRSRRSVASSREDLMYADPSHKIRSSSEHLTNKKYNAMPVHSRSLERGYVEDFDADKENTFKTRITVISPEGNNMNMMSRKPYKTTINTATDNIQYRGYHGENGHYKVPRNKTPVDPGFFRYRGQTDSDQSSSVMGYNPYNRSSRSQFNSARLVKNVANDHRRHSSGMAASRELDREGRMIRSRTSDGIMTDRTSVASSLAPSHLGTGRSRNYSGCSTSPDREISPDRYAKPRGIRSYSSGSHQPQVHMMHRSPSTSPTRPPRSRSSPTREMHGIRRVASRRGEVDRSPSAARMMNRSPIKDIRSASRERPIPPARRERSNDGRRSAMSAYGIRSSSNALNKNDDSDERLARFTEYRGDDGGGGNHHSAPPRKSSLRYTNEPASDRERGQSLPPGATIESMRDFYKSSQYKSMYALPPSPNRPAPVLDRADRAISSSTLHRDRGGPPPAASSRLARSASKSHQVSISEGDMTGDDMSQRGTRPRSRMTSSPVGHGIRTKRQAPSPPGLKPQGRRVISSDRLDNGPRIDHGRRVVSNERGLIHPPSRRILVGRRPSDGLDSSYSESEMNGETDQVGK